MDGDGRNDFFDYFCGNLALSFQILTEPLVAVIASNSDVVRETELNSCIVPVRLVRPWSRRQGSTITGGDNKKAVEDLLANCVPQQPINCARR